MNNHLLSHIHLHHVYVKCFSIDLCLKLNLDLLNILNMLPHISICSLYVDPLCLMIMHKMIVIWKWLIDVLTKRMALMVLVVGWNRLVYKWIHKLQWSLCDGLKRIFVEFLVLWILGHFCGEYISSFLDFMDLYVMFYGNGVIHSQMMKLWHYLCTCYLSFSIFYEIWNLLTEGWFQWWFYEKLDDSTILTHFDSWS